MNVFSPPDRLFLPDPPRAHQGTQLCPVAAEGAASYHCELLEITLGRLDLSVCSTLNRAICTPTGRRQNGCSFIRPTVRTLNA